MNIDRSVGAVINCKLKDDIPLILIKQINITCYQKYSEVVMHSIDGIYRNISRYLLPIDIHSDYDFERARKVKTWETVLVKTKLWVRVHGV